MAAIPNKMFTHKRIQKMLEAYRDDPTVFATENEYYLALYAKEMWQRLNALKEWTERYRLNTESIEAFMKRETAKPKKNSQKTKLVCLTFLRFCPALRSPPSG